MKKNLAIGIIVFLTSISPVGAIQAQRNNVKSFAQLCTDKKTLSVATRRMIDLLLLKAETTDCQQANRRLGNLTELDLEAPYSANNPTIDLTPLANLTNLTSLNLSFNKINDVKPLASLTNLTELNLASTPISDVKPLGSLTKLTKLNLSFTPISDVKPLASLTKLTELYLIFNKISDVKPLASLTKLIELYLSGNKISDVRSLKSLTKLTVLDLRGTEINPKDCPVKPETICKIEGRTF
jgi:internalin A